jgi:hypothetical protein
MPQAYCRARPAAVLGYWLPVAGYSGTPLTIKLGIREDSVFTLLHAPDGFDVDLPPGVTVRHRARGQCDVALAFFTTVARVQAQADVLGQMVFPAGGLWIAWPKRSSGRATDVTDHELRRILLPGGLVDNKVCAVDDIWTGMRFVWRRENRVGDDGGR